MKFSIEYEANTDDDDFPEKFLKLESAQPQQVNGIEVQPCKATILENLKILKHRLRAAFGSSLKYCPRYTEKYPQLWRNIINGEKCPKGINLLTVAGDYFAFWYTEYGLPPDKYTEIAKEFFVEPWSK